MLLGEEAVLPWDAERVDEDETGGASHVRKLKRYDPYFEIKKKPLRGEKRSEFLGIII